MCVCECLRMGPRDYMMCVCACVVLCVSVSARMIVCMGHIFLCRFAVVYLCLYFFVNIFRYLCNMYCLNR